MFQKLKKRYIGDQAFYRMILGLAEWIKCAIGFVMVKKGVWIQNIVS